MAKHKVLKTYYDGIYYKIEEDLLSQSCYFYVYSKNGECIHKITFNNIEEALKHGASEYKINVNSWAKSSVKLGYTIDSDHHSEIIDDINKLKVIPYAFRISPIIIWTSILLIGLLFKIMHWPGSAILILFTSAGLTAWSVTDCYFLKGKNNIVNVLSVAGAMWIILMIWGIIFNGGYPYNLGGFIVYLVIFSIYMLAYLFVKFYKVKKKSKALT